MEYPKNANGPLGLLAQISFAEFEPYEDFRSSGLLAIYYLYRLNKCYLYGANLENGYKIGIGKKSLFFPLFRFFNLILNFDELKFKGSSQIVNIRLADRQLDSVFQLNNKVCRNVFCNIFYMIHI